MADKGPQRALLPNDHWHYGGVISGGLIKFIMMEGREAFGTVAQAEGCAAATGKGVVFDRDRDGRTGS